MWKPIYQPDPWPKFVKRKDIIGLPLMEQRRKFMEEQILFENYVSSINTVNTVSTAAAGAAGGPAPGSGGGTPSYTALTNANFNTAISEWFSDQAAAEAEYGLIGEWNTTDVTSMRPGFNNKTTFNEDISAWDVSNVTDMRFMFSGATSFNQDISGWDVSSLSDGAYLFRDASSFNQDLSSWDIGSFSIGFGTFQNAGLSTTNYSNILIGWAAQTVQPNVNLWANGIQYSAGAAATARGVLTSAPNNWTITDAGQA